MIRRTLVIGALVALLGCGEDESGPVTPTDSAVIADASGSAGLPSLEEYPDAILKSLQREDVESFLALCSQERGSRHSTKAMRPMQRENFLRACNRLDWSAASIVDTEQRIKPSAGPRHPAECDMTIELKSPGYRKISLGVRDICARQERWVIETDEPLTIRVSVERASAVAGPPSESLEDFAERVVTLLANEDVKGFLDVCADRFDHIGVADIEASRLELGDSAAESRRTALAGGLDGVSWDEVRRQREANFRLAAQSRPWTDVYVVAADGEILQTGGVYRCNAATIKSEHDGHVFTFDIRQIIETPTGWKLGGADPLAVRP